MFTRDNTFVIRAHLPGVDPEKDIDIHFSLDRAREELVGIGAPTHILDAWMAESLHQFVGWSLAGAYRPMNHVLEALLPAILNRPGIHADQHQRQTILQSLERLSPAKGAEAACSKVAGEGWKLMAVTNGSEASARALLERADLARYFSDVVSSDGPRKAKPHPDVYATAQDRARGLLWLVSSHAWDIAGAAGAGLRTGWVTGDSASYPDAYPQPDIVAPDLASLASKLVGAANPGMSLPGEGAGAGRGGGPGTWEFV